MIEYLKIYPLIGLKAIQGKHGNAWRSWSLARYLDHAGSGWVGADDLHLFFDSLKIHKKTQKRWIKNALATGLLVEERSVNGAIYRILGVAACAFALGCERNGAPAEIPLEHFVSKGWRASVQIALLVTLPEGQPISQATMREISGVPERTQRSRLSRVPIVKYSNFVETDITPDMLAGLQEFGDLGGCYFKNRSGKVFQRLPNVYSVSPDFARSVKKGRTKKAQKLVNLLFQREQDKGGEGRLFFPTNERFEQAHTSRKYRQQGRSEPGEAFVFRKHLKSANLWEKKRR